MQLHVRRVVEPEAPPVLLLHGLGVGGAVWQAFARRLLPHLAAIAPDLRGHAQSDAPASGYEPADYAADLLELIADFQLPTPLPVVGHSLGALVGLALGDLAPTAVSWLALLDPPLDPELRNSEVPTVFDLRHSQPGELEQYLLTRNPRGGQLLAQSLGTLFRQASDGAFEAMLGRAAVPPVPPKAPWLVVQADPDRGGVLGDAAAAALGATRLMKIGGAPHAVHASHPEQVARAILEFGGYVSSDSSPSA